MATPPQYTYNYCFYATYTITQCYAHAQYNASIPTRSEGLGLHFEPNQYNVALKWWLGLDTSCGSSCAFCPDSILDPLGHHASTCKRGGDAVHRHNLLRDVFADSCRLAHLPVKLEVGNNLTQTMTTVDPQMSSSTIGHWASLQPLTSV